MAERLSTNHNNYEYSLEHNEDVLGAGGLQVRFSSVIQCDSTRSIDLRSASQERQPKGRGGAARAAIEIVGKTDNTSLEHVHVS